MTIRTIMAALAGEVFVGALIWLTMVAWRFRGRRQAARKGESGAVNQSRRRRSC